MVAVKNSMKRRAGALALGADYRRQRFEPDAHQRGRRWLLSEAAPREAA
jgi:hypothetical protein